MFSIYTLFKFIHVAAVIIWIGGVCVLTLINARLAREKEPAGLLSLSRLSNFYGRAVIGPAAIITLIAGIATAASVGMDFGALWLTWGFVGILGHFVLGIGFIRRATARLNELAPSVVPTDPRIRASQGRLTMLNVINLLLLFSVVAAMVFKPTL
jgi:uncharacterized membrane protein